MAEVSARPPFEIVIERSRGWLKVDWHELWEYRDLLMLLVQRDFISRYKQTLLGPVWFILQPVLTTLVFVVIFGLVAGIPTDGIPAPLFYLCGLLGWNYFSQNITSGGATFINNAALFGKVYFPRLVVPISIIIANLVAFAFQCVPFLAFYIFYKCSAQSGSIDLTWWALLAPLPLLQVALLSLGVSLWMSASTAKFRDLVHLNTFIVQLWMYATPIVYPLSKVPPHLQWITWANPMSVPVEAFRICLLGRGTLGWTAIIISVVTTLILLVTGVAMFRRVERTVIDLV